MSSMSVPICNHFHAKQANSGKITSFQVGCLFSPPRLKKTLAHRHEICHELLYTLGYYGKNPKSLSHMCVDRYQDVTQEQTDKQTKLP